MISGIELSIGISIVFGAAIMATGLTALFGLMSDKRDLLASNDELKGTNEHLRGHNASLEMQLERAKKNCEGIRWQDKNIGQWQRVIKCKCCGLERDLDAFPADHRMCPNCADNQDGDGETVRIVTIEEWMIQDGRVVKTGVGEIRQTVDDARKCGDPFYGIKINPVEEA